MANIIYGMLNVASTALITQQKALDVTANNIANVNTEGYSRQRVNLEQNEPVYYEDGILSTGVQAQQYVQRIYDQFLNAQIAESESELGRWDAELETLEKVELMFDETSGYGLNDALSEFWNSWQELSNNPDGYVERTTLIADTQNLTEVFNSLSTSLSEVQSDTDLSITGAVEEINTLSSEIADLNLKIAEVEAGGYSANTFRDERDLKLQELSALIDVNSFEDADGYLTVTTANGNTLVDRANSWELTTNTNADGFQDVYWVSSTGTEENITDDITTGKLKGWIEARDETIPGYIDQLDDLAATIIDAVNTLHSAGTNLDGTTGTASGTNFFTGSDASNIAINTDIEDNPNLIAAADTTEAIPGGSENAIAIAELQNSLLMSGGTSTIDDFYNSLASEVGSDVSQAEVNSEHQSTISLELSTYREEVSGVSLDEEMVDLIQFQSAYNAAAQLVTTVDEMLETLISMV
ncbi:flagellar hook-associated protein 1 [Desulfosarcina ovata subsp. sediminis]|uniref:Flagellar hook-associated protein 1 n=1 Tax=Desulfosarcina ovata subsp. sediminis TaxID=885957 RepID=A0A5K7ZQQ4_9BACT|nr:flagellar hook-associated protein FlgK [Desulfosarcina ovata]BBO79823.1 flagellar hook-associated protein 1 [Desulfosarcina ovata subsp. sediminis]